MEFISFEVNSFTKGETMSLVVPSKFNQPGNHSDEMIETAKRRAQQDFENEQAEALLKSTYEAEKARLRKGGPPVSQPKPALHANPPKPKEPSPMQKQLDLERQANAIQAQAPFVPDSKPTGPTPETSEADGQFAVKVIEVWKASVQAKKDFPNVAAFHAHCAECRDKEGQLRPDQKGIVGLAYYKKLINLEKGRLPRR
jgi:hypothetical protein